MTVSLHVTTCHLLLSGIDLSLHSIASLRMHPLSKGKYVQPTVVLDVLKKMIQFVQCLS